MVKCKVLIIGPAPPQIGGMETFVGDLLRSPLSRKFDIIFLNISKPAITRSSSFRAVTGYAGSFRRNIFKSLVSYSYSLFFIVKFIFYLLTNQVRIVHIHTASYTSFWEKTVYILLGKFVGARVVLHIHGAKFKDFIDESNKFVRRLLLTFLKKPDRIIVLSRYWSAYFSQLFASDSRIRVVENGISLDDFDRIKAIRASVPTILFLGEVGMRKGVYDLLLALSFLKKERIEFRAIIVGPGELEKAASYARELGIADKVEFSGPRSGDEKIRLLKQASCFVLPSYAEGLPIAIIEAFAAGLPVVSTNVGGIPDLVESGRNGFLVPPGNGQALASALTTLLGDRPLMDRISQQNLQDARTKYDIENVAKKVAAIYNELLTRP